jgi:S1-C subfamily serine protease
MAKLKLGAGLAGAVVPILLVCGGMPQVRLSFGGQTGVTTPVSLSVAATPAAPSLAPPTLPPPPTPLPADIMSAADAEEQLLVNLYERVNPSVVSIQAIKTVAQFQHPQLPQGFPTPEMPGTPFQESGEGSGFVVDTSGHIVTNEHVVVDTTELQVTFSDGAAASANIVGTDPDTDLAVIQVNMPAESLRPVIWGDSDQVHVGDRAIAIGNPFGYENTMTIGIISGLSRSLPATSGFRIPEIIQTDAAINPGNSGGPLLNSEGQVIGINTAIVPSLNQFGERSFLGIGFAIPSNQAYRVTQALIESGAYDHPWIGFSGMNVLPAVATEMNLPRVEGALVISVVPGGPAERAGLRGGTQNIQVMGQDVTIGGDVVIAINDQPVHRFDDILVYLSRYGQVGQTVALTIIRSGQSQLIDVTLEKRPASAPATSTELP